MSAEEIKKQKDLLDLKRLTTEPRVFGWCSNMWLIHLLDKYSWEYLMFTQYSTLETGRRKRIKEKIKEKWIFRLSEIQKLHLEEKDIEFLNGMLDCLDDFIEEKKTKNNN